MQSFLSLFYLFLFSFQVFAYLLYIFLFEMHKKSILNCFKLFEECDWKMFAYENCMTIESELVIQMYCTLL